jgi:hypothetical protein
MPPVPWSNFVQMTDEDLRAMYACLKTIPPVNSIEPGSQPPKEW